jgi:NADPH:quinone reductase-like Zn-dependent oxidoreductase
VRVRSSGINRSDLGQRRGHYPAPPGWPQDVLGLEYAGTVDAVGRGVRSFGVGDPVMGIVGGGGYSEAVVVSEREALRVPDGMDLLRAGAVPEAFLTAWDALVLQAGLGGGETVLVHAAGSGVGTAASQIAKAVGARALGTSRTPEKLERAAGLGLERGIVAGDDGAWVDEVIEATGGRGVDVILDLVGAAYAPGNVRCLAARGRWIVVGRLGGSDARLDLRTLMERRATITGTLLRPRPAEERALLARSAERRLVPLLASGALEPVVAHRRMEADLTFGKLLIDWEWKRGGSS